MKKEAKILKKRENFKCSNGLEIFQPTLDEIDDGFYIGEGEDKTHIEIEENNYFKLINLFITRPWDIKVDLWDNEIDYVEVSDYDVFIMLWNSGIYKDIIKFLIGDYNLEIKVNSQNKMVVLADGEDIIIDKLTYEEIARYIRHIHFIPYKTEFNPANKTARKRIIDRERKKQEREKRKTKKERSIFKDYMSSLIWIGNSGYTWDTIGNITVFQMYEGIKRISKEKLSNNLSSGIYSGSIDYKKINEDDLNWVGNLNKEE